MGLPCGRRTPRGRLRWYLVHVPEGHEASTCERVRALVGPELLEDAFVMSKERWFKRRGIWFLQPVQMYRGYFFVATRDVIALDRELSKLSFPARVVGFREHAYMPLADVAQRWFEGSLDGSHTLRNSVGVIEGGSLCVQSGPLVGQEGLLSKIDRHRRCCLVHVGAGESGFTEQMPLNVPFKS